jgi:hypothetical protein
MIWLAAVTAAHSTVGAHSVTTGESARASVRSVTEQSADEGGETRSDGWPWLGGLKWRSRVALALLGAMICEWLSLLQPVGHVRRSAPVSSHPTPPPRPTSDGLCGNGQVATSMIRPTGVSPRAAPPPPNERVTERNSARRIRNRGFSETDLLTYPCEPWLIDKALMQQHHIPVSRNPQCFDEEPTRGDGASSTLRCCSR